MSATTQSAAHRQQPTPARHGPLGVAVSDRTYWIALTLILILGAVARYAFLGARPGWEYDEPVYTTIANNLATGHGLHDATQFDAVKEPYLYQPPFYFVLLAGWMKIFGTGITVARYFSATASLLYTLLMVQAVRKLVGNRAAVSAAVFLTFDAWLLFENRIAWLDNSMMVPLCWSVLAFSVAWRKRLEPGAERRWVLFGVALGVSMIYKHLGTSAVIGYAITWALLWRGHGAWRPRRAALIAMSVSGLILVVYFLSMIAIWPHDYLRETLDQFLRSIGKHKSNGSVNVSERSVVNAIRSKYWLYAGTAIANATAFFVGARRIVKRNIDESLVLWALGTGGFIFLAVLGMRFPNYFILVFVPLIAYFGVVVSQQSPTEIKRWVLVPCTLLLVLNLVGATIRETWRHDNTLRLARDWLDSHSSSTNVLIADEPVGNIVHMRYCRTTYASQCGNNWEWIVTYTSLTQRLPTESAFVSDLHQSVQCVQFDGFKERVSIYVRGHGSCAAILAAGQK